MSIPYRHHPVGPGPRAAGPTSGGGLIPGRLRHRRVHLACGMLAQKTVLHPAPTGGQDGVDLGALETDPSHPCLVTLSIKGGGMRLLAKGGPEPLVVDEGFLIFGHSAGSPASITVTGPRPEIVILVIPMRGLEPLIGGPQHLDLLQTLGIAAPGAFSPLLVPTHLNELHQSILPVGLNERASALYASAKALEFLSFLSDHMDSEPRPWPLQLHPALTSRSLRQHFQAPSAGIHTVDSLARHFQVTPRRIKAFFKQEFGMSLHAFLTQQHLNLARTEILATDIPLKELAAQLGYSHVNNFTTAFRNHFGYTPGSLRRRDPLGEAASG